MGRFCNYLTQIETDEAVEERNGRWYIKVGFAGFNTKANNSNGYATKEKAEAAVVRYQNRKGPYTK